MSPATTTLFERIDGHQSVEGIVDEFYKRVLADEALKGLFADNDMDRQRCHQTNFISMALGGPKCNSGRGFESTHNGLRITDGHFDCATRHLHDTLARAGAGPDEVRAVLAIVGPLKNDAMAAWPHDRSL